MLWDLFQQMQLSDHRTHATTMEGRVEQLERQLGETRELLGQIIRHLEQRDGQDLDGDGRVG